MNQVLPLKNRCTSSEDNLARYMKDVRKFPMLDKETEADLARRWRDRRDP
jgi:RNA polymerase sigma-32 factor